MNALDILREDLAETIVLKLHGTFNGPAALKLRETIEALGDRGVVIDFSRVGHFHDLAIPILTRGLQHPHLEVRGLDRHHERVFQVFGVSASDRREEREYWKPEEALAAL